MVIGGLGFEQAMLSPDSDPEARNGQSLRDLFHRQKPFLPQSTIARIELIITPKAGDDAATERLAFARKSSPGVQDSHKPLMC